MCDISCMNFAEAQKYKNQSDCRAGYDFNQVFSHAIGFKYSLALGPGRSNRQLSHWLALHERAPSQENESASTARMHGDGKRNDEEVQKRTDAQHISTAHLAAQGPFLATFLRRPNQVLRLAVVLLHRSACNCGAKQTPRGRRRQSCGAKGAIHQDSAGV